MGANEDKRQTLGAFDPTAPMDPTPLCPLGPRVPAVSLRPSAARCAPLGPLLTTVPPLARCAPLGRLLPAMPPSALCAPLGPMLLAVPPSARCGLSAAIFTREFAVFICGMCGMSTEPADA